MFHSTENKSNVDCGIVVEKESVEKREKKLEDVSKMRRTFDTPSHHNFMRSVLLCDKQEVVFLATLSKDILVIEQV